VLARKKLIYLMNHPGGSCDQQPREVAAGSEPAPPDGETMMTDPRSGETAATLAATTGVAALVACIESSPIRACAPQGSPSCDWAPAGYDDTDIRILDWIASHRRGRHARARPADLAA
jgi:hypothetical protein